MLPSEAGAAAQTVEMLITEIKAIAGGTLEELKSSASDSTQSFRNMAVPAGAFGDVPLAQRVAQQHAAAHDVFVSTRSTGSSRTSRTSSRAARQRDRPRADRRRRLPLPLVKLGGDYRDHQLPLDENWNAGPRRAPRRPRASLRTMAPMVAGTVPVPTRAPRVPVGLVRATPAPSTASPEPGTPRLTCRRRHAHRRCLHAEQAAPGRSRRARHRSARRRGHPRLPRTTPVPTGPRRESWWSAALQLHQAHREVTGRGGEHRRRGQRPGSRDPGDRRCRHQLREDPLHLAAEPVQGELGSQQATTAAP